MKGSFAEGLKLVPSIEKNLEEYALFVDRHRILVFNYKIATFISAPANMKQRSITCKRSLTARLIFA
jgi:hypothetical protein